MGCSRTSGKARVIIKNNRESFVYLFQIGINIKKLVIISEVIKNEEIRTFIVDPQTGFRDEDTMYPYTVYEVEIDDVIAGKGEWKEAFRYYRGR